MGAVCSKLLGKKTIKSTDTHAMILLRAVFAQESNDVDAAQGTEIILPGSKEHQVRSS